MVTITVERGKHAQERAGEELWVFECDDQDVARRLSDMLTGNGQFQSVITLAGHSASFTTLKAHREHCEKTLENLAVAANMGKEVEMVFS